MKKFSRAAFLSCVLWFTCFGATAQVLNLAQAGLLESGYGAVPNLSGASLVAVQGNYAYVVGTGDVLEIFDITLPGLPLHKGSLANGVGGANIQRAQGLFVSGNYAYITSIGGNALEIVDVSDPANPVHKGSIFDGGGSAPYLNEPWGVFVAGNYAYVASALSNALEIIDVSNPAYPVHKGVLHDGAGATPYLLGATNVYVSGNYAYITGFVGPSSPTLTGAIEIVDISNPALPKHAGAIKDGGGVAPYLYGPVALRLNGSNLFVTATDPTGGGPGALEILDVSNPANPIHKGSLLSGGLAAAPFLYNPYSIDISGNYAFVVNYINGNSGTLEVVDISNPAVPVHKTSLISTYFHRARSISIKGTYAYVAARTNDAMTIVDISNPASPFIKATATTGSGGALMPAPQSVFVSNNYAFVTSIQSNSLEIVNVTNPAIPLHAASITDGSGGAKLSNPVSAVVSGDYAFVASSSSNALEIIDVSNPAVPVHAGSLVDGSGGASLQGVSSVFVSGSFAYLTSSPGALEIVDVSNPATPVHRGKLFSGTGVAPYLIGANHVYVSGNYAYVTSNNALEIIDVSSPGAPVHKGSLLDGGGVAPFLTTSLGGNALYVSGNYAYITDNTHNALEIVDVSNPAAPVHKGSLKDGNGSAPFLLGPVGVSLYGNYALIAYNVSGFTTSLVSGVEVVDVSNPASPVHYSNFAHESGGALLDAPTSIFVSGNYAYMTNYGIYFDLDIAYLFGPSISTFSPASGAVGASVTVNGQNFNTFLTATIGGTSAPITSVSATSATITVPPNCTVGRIVLNYLGEKATTATNFIVIPTTATATLIKQNGFTANWSNVGASGYYLDVSLNNFASFVAGYNNLSVGNVTSYIVTGLAAGTTYQYRVRSTDGSIMSANSNATSVLTIPLTPAFNAPTLLTQNSFAISWNTVTGASSYNLDIATDAAFTQFNGSGTFSNLSLTQTSQSVTGLAAGTTYYCQVRSTDASGTSPNSASVTTITIPGNPSALAATSITNNGFTVNWSAATGASTYYLDVSTDNFVTYQSGYNNQSVGSATSTAITGLSFGTGYQYRLRASDASGTSGNSNVVTVLTSTPAPAAQPTNLTFTNAGSTSVTVSYTVASGSPTGYLVLRSPGVAPSTAPVNGATYAIGNPLGGATIAYNGQSLTFFDGGLTNSTTYYYNVYSYNGSGAGINYLTTSPLQGSVTMDITAPLISLPGTPNPTTITLGNTPNFNASITDNVSVATAQLFHRGISKGIFNSAQMSPSGVSGNYTIQIQTDWYDSLGMEYYFMASDENGNSTTKPSVTSYAQLLTPSITLPPLPVGTTATEYRIISLPYVLSTDNKVTTVYNGVPWDDNSKAALWWWDPTAKGGTGEYDQYGVGTNLQTVDVGKGYWAQVSSSFSPQLTNVAAPKYNRANLYPMTLRPNWNQVGNPYPVPVSWDDVVSLNAQLNPSAQFSTLNIYDGTGYKTASGNTLLKAFEGGFVKNLGSSDITIYIPFNGQTQLGSRVTATNTEGAWSIFMHITQGQRSNQLGGFGMHPLAQAGADRYDNFNPPRFVDDPEINFSDPDYHKGTFSKDVVKTQDQHTWQFAPEGKTGEQAELSWNNDASNIISKPLYLVDDEEIKIVDMTESDHYPFTLSTRSNFHVYYGIDKEHISTQTIQAGSVYPNPLTAEGGGAVRLGLPEGADTYTVVMNVYTVQGDLVETVNRTLEAGIQQLDFRLPSTIFSGVFIYRLVVSSEKSSKVFNGKIVRP